MCRDDRHEGRAFHGAAAWNHSSPPAGRSGGGRRDLWAGKGVLSAVRLGRVIPRGGSSGSEKGKPTFFFIVKDAVECDGLISNEPGRWISERKEPTKVSEGRERGEDAAPQGLQLPGRVWLWMNLSSASPRMSSDRESCGFTPAFFPLTGQQKSRGKVWIFPPVLGCVRGDRRNMRARSAASWVLRSGLQESELRQVFQPSSPFCLFFSSSSARLSIQDCGESPSWWNCRALQTFYGGFLSNIVCFWGNILNAISLLWRI